MSGASTHESLRPGNLSPFVELVLISFKYYRRNFMSILMSMGLPLVFLAIYAVIYFATSGVQELRVGVPSSRHAALEASLGRLARLGIVLVPLQVSAEESITRGQVRVAIRYDAERNFTAVVVPPTDAVTGELVVRALRDATSDAAVGIAITPLTRASLAFLPGILVMALMNLSLFFTGSRLLQERSTGQLRLFKLSPASIPSVLGADVCVNLALSLIQVLFFILVGNLLFDLKLSTANTFLSCVVGMFAALNLAALAIALGASLRSFSRGVHIFTMVNLAFIFLGDLLYPASAFNVTRPIAAALPTTHVVSLLRALWLDLDPSFPVYTSTLYLVAFPIAMLIVARLTFRFNAAP